MQTHILIIILFCLVGISLCATLLVIRGCVKMGNDIFATLEEIKSDLRILDRRTSIKSPDIIDPSNKTISYKDLAPKYKPASLGG